MERLKTSLKNLFQWETESPTYDRMTREIKGSIFTLLALFELIALTSYLPLDSFNLFSGRIDHINNLAGIVGAIVAEWFLGTTGVMGYTIILITGYMALCAFRGIPLRTQKTRVIGITLAAILGAIAFYLAMHETTPEASLLQGGYIGKILGSLLAQYFNTTGALLIVIGGFVLTVLVTTTYSFMSPVMKAMGIEERVEIKVLKADLEEEKAEPTVKAATPAKKIQAAEAVAAEKPKRQRKKKAAKTDEAATTTAVDPSEEITAVIDLGVQAEETAAEIESEGEKAFEFKELIPVTTKYPIPSPRLLKNAPSVKKMSKSEIKECAQKLCEHLLSFQITGDVVSVSTGPVLTTYEFKPSAGIKLSKIAALQDDLGVVLGTRQLRIMAPIPGKTVVGIEVPREEIETISLKDLISDKEFQNKKLRLPIAIGKTTDGNLAFGDMAAMPHLLVAGSTGSGKSVFVNSLIMSLIFRCTPQELRLILVDPKMLELNIFDGLPHLVTNVITDNRIAFNALSWAVWEMDRRYNLMAKTGSKNIDSYNEKQKGEGKLPFMVIIVDELADLMMSGGEAVEIAITRLAQKARAAGIHMVLATQRPSTDVVTGLIKANVPSRISFKVPSGVDSRTVLDTGGAEDLIGRGDCLMIQPAIPIRRLHGTFVTEEELKRAVKFAIDGKDHSKNYLDFSGSNPAFDNQKKKK